MARILLVVALAAVAVTGGGLMLRGSGETELAAGLSAHNLSSGGRPVHVVAAGDPALPPVLFIHGSPGSWEAWQDYLADPELSSRAHLLAIDRPGFGGPCLFCSHSPESILPVGVG